MNSENNSAGNEALKTIMKPYKVRYEYSFIYDDEVEIYANSMDEAKQIVSEMSERSELDNGQDSFHQDFLIIDVQESEVV